jgi:hypothetical protein
LRQPNNNAQLYLLQAGSSPAGLFLVIAIAVRIQTVRILRHFVAIWPFIAMHQNNCCYAKSDIELGIWYA